VNVTTVITGASRGIGRALADELIRRDDLVINLSRTIPAHDDMRSIPCDVSDYVQVKHAFRVIEHGIGAVPDVLVCNAGYASPPQPIRQTSVFDFGRAFEVNVNGSFYAARQFLRGVQWPGEGFGIVFVASTAALSPRPEWYAYAASKAAVVSLARGIAAEFPRLNVLTVAPGRTATELRQVLAPDEQPGEAQSPEAVALVIADAIAEMRRGGTRRVFDGEPLIVKGE
jgi:NAD(P)-dependent dehydrogenase (short-subunit alcohol dehydrogenase family)